FSPDGRTLASCSGAWSDGIVSPAIPSPGEVILWDLSAHKVRARLPHKDRVFGIAYSPEGSTLATACWNGAVTVWRSDLVDGPEPDRPPVKDNPKANEDLHFVFALGEGAIADVPELRKEYPQDYHPTLKG